MRTIPGVSSGGVTANAASTVNNVSGGFNINGTRSAQHEYTVDGVTNLNLGNNTGAIVSVNPDALQEVKVLTSNYQAEYGRAGGGFIALTTRGGTNQLHGGGRYFRRHDSLNADPYFNNLRGGSPAGFTRPLYRYNFYGWDLGGPIVTAGGLTFIASAMDNYLRAFDILTGDPKAGEAYFAGAGKCATCHSPTSDLKGVGAKYDAVTLQGRILMPRGGRGAGPPQPAYLDKNAIKASITLPSRQTISGVLVRLTDFDVTLYDPPTGQVRSWFRNGDVPKIELADPLQAHLDRLPGWTDSDMHNVTAYLAGLK
jgi:mono/diheme cytochrome c family protein